MKPRRRKSPNDDYNKNLFSVVYGVGCSWWSITDVKTYKTKKTKKKRKDFLVRTFGSWTPVVWTADASCWAAAPVKISDNDVRAVSPERPNALLAPGLASNWANGRALASADEAAAAATADWFVASPAPPCDRLSIFALWSSTLYNPSFKWQVENVIIKYRASMVSKSNPFKMGREQPRNADRWWGRF